MNEPVPGIGSGWPVQFSSGPLPTMQGAPVLGMHNKEILTKILSYTTEQIAELESNGII